MKIVKEIKVMNDSLKYSVDGVQSKFYNKDDNCWYKVAGIKKTTSEQKGSLNMLPLYF